jgi:hypothetical protein
MTEAQAKRFYFPAWRRCAEANDWVMVCGRLRGSPETTMNFWPEPARTAGAEVLKYAEQLAAQEHRAVTATDLRHGCNMAATGGRRQSSYDMDNRETNRVVVLFRLLQDPEDLDAVMEWLHPEIADKRSLVQFIKKQAPEAALVAISKNAWGTIFWEDAEVSRLRWLLKQVKGRTEMGKAESRNQGEPF